MAHALRPGDLVNVCARQEYTGSWTQGIVIAVLPSNSIPDAIPRGLVNIWPFSYWVMTNERVVGPVMRDYVKPL